MNSITSTDLLGTSQFDRELSVRTSDFDDDPIQSLASLEKPTIWSRLRKRTDLLIALFALFLAEADRGIVLPTIFNYVKSFPHSSDTLYGVTIAVFSVGRLLSSILLGYLMDILTNFYTKKGRENPEVYASRDVLLFAGVLSVIGSLMYLFAKAAGEYGLWIVIFSRTIIGFGSGILSVVRALISSKTNSEDRTRWFGYSNGVQFLGFGLIPGLGIVLHYLNSDIGFMVLNEENSPGLIATVFHLAGLALVFFLGHSSKRQETELEQPLLLQNVDEEEQEYHYQHSDLRERGLKWSQVSDSESPLAQSPESPSARPIENETNRLHLQIGIACFIFFNFVARGLVALLETLATPMFLSLWADRTHDSTPATKTASTFFLILGILGLFTYLLLPLHRRISVMTEPLLLSISFFLTAIASSLLIPTEIFTFPTFVIATTFLWSLASPVAQTIILAAFSRVVGGQNIGSWMGIVGSAGSVGRIVMPMIGSSAGRVSGFTTVVIASALSGIMVLAYTKVVTKSWIGRKPSF